MKVSESELDWQLIAFKGGYLGPVMISIHVANCSKIEPSFLVKCCSLCFFSAKYSILAVFNQ